MKVKVSFIMVDVVKCGTKDVKSYIVVGTDSVKEAKEYAIAELQNHDESIKCKAIDSTKMKNEVIDITFYETIPDAITRIYVSDGVIMVENDDNEGGES